MLDLLVIGAGLSGLSAALAAAQAGLRVRVIAKGLGRLHWHTGTLDVLGYLPGDNTPVNRPLDALDELDARHPYRLLGAPAVYAALAQIRQSLEAAGLPLYTALPGENGRENGREDGHNTDAPAHTENMLLPTAVGAARPTWAAPAGQVNGDLARPEPMLLVGFAGLRDFYPAMIAEHLQEQGTAARAAWLPLDVLTSQRDRNSVQLAHHLDEAAAVDRLAAALKPLLRPGERVGLPAVLGMARHAAVLTRVQESLAAPVFEIPTLPPSVPGIRIHRALVAQLTQLGVRVEAGMTALRAGGNGPRLEWVESATSSRPLRHRAGAFLLATGGVLGGGFGSDSTGRMWESVFDLPLTTPPARQGWFRAEFLDPRGHPVFLGGVAVDSSFRPTKPDTDTPCFENLWAAGNCLAHVDSIRERSTEGIAIATGVAAGMAAARTGTV